MESAAIRDPKSVEGNLEGREQRIHALTFFSSLPISYQGLQLTAEYRNPEGTAIH